MQDVRITAISENLHDIFNCWMGKGSAMRRDPFASHCVLRSQCNASLIATDCWQPYDPSTYAAGSSNARLLMDNTMRALKTSKTSNLQVLWTCINKFGELMEQESIGRQEAESRLAACQSELATCRVPQSSRSTCCLQLRGTA